MEFLAAMERYKQADPGMAAVLVALKATVKGGVGQLRERPQGMSYKRGEQWAALECPTWRPDIRAAVISRGERQLVLTCNVPVVRPWAAVDLVQLDHGVSSVVARSDLFLDVLAWGLYGAGDFQLGMNSADVTQGHRYSA
ncbi:hypothetical protein [Streptomyces liangshanensis]|uniref:hypothetical protein n=1 Tax=Streptomyces liangshanensis TaxID=2717324 RepID=UPI001AAFADDD